jgi:hypothetical protein
MQKPALLIAAVVVGVMTLCLECLLPGSSVAADQKLQATTQPKAITPKAVAPKAKPKMRAADTAAKTDACFGVAPQIEKLVPDEGHPGVKVTIKGTEFGSPECLRGVSFGPGQSAAFSMGNESTIVATVPTSSRKGLVIVTVTTASGEDSKPFLIK